MNINEIQIEDLEKEINLKELQIKSLLTITQAINENVEATGLFHMYSNFVSWDIGFERMILFIPNEHGVWEKVAGFGDISVTEEDIIAKLPYYHKVTILSETDHETLHDFDYVIPVFHKEKPIAYSLIGGFRDEKDQYNKIQFVITITNIIAVAIENKRLFKQQLEQQNFKKELELAKNVQNMLIPTSLPKTDQYDIASIYRPHSNIGGDYFDFIKFSDTKFAICIADISGKGISAALLMANFQAMIQSLVYQYRDLETFVFALNQSVMRITKGERFITFFIAEIDTFNKKLKYVNAGHYPPVLRNGDKTAELTKGCTVIGAFENMPEIEEGQVDLEDDALLLCFTDGLAELQDQSGDFFDGERIREFVMNHSEKNATSFNKSLMKEIDVFKGQESFSDDIAVITCKLDLTK